MTPTRDATAANAVVATEPADFYAWSCDTAAKLRARQCADLDWDQLAAEWEDRGANRRHALENRLVVLLMCLLNGRYQPRRQSKGWRLTLREQRLQIARLLKPSPRRGHHLPAWWVDAYANARTLAADDTELPLDPFPQDSEFPLDAVLDEAFFPDAAPPPSDAVTGGA